MRFDGDVSGNDLNDNLLGTPLSFEINSFDKSEKPAPKALTNEPMDLQKWRELTGHDRQSVAVRASAELIEIRGARPIVRIEMHEPLPSAIMEIADTDDLPFRVQIFTVTASE